MRKFVLISFGVAWMTLLFVPFFPLLWVWPTRRWRQNVSRVYSKVWSLGCLWVAGIRLRYEGAEHLDTFPAVFTFNHTSMLDFFVNACFAPRNTLVFGKRELVRVPIMGWMWFCGAHPMIVRHDKSQWEKVLESVERGLASGQNCTIIAPEGTRSRDGQLLPFKKGPFVIAMKSKAPIVPVVLKGMTDAYSKENGFRPGTVVVKILPPIPTDDWTLETLRENVDAVRETYVRELEAQASAGEAAGERAATDTSTAEGDQAANATEASPGAGETTGTKGP